MHADIDWGEVKGDLKIYSWAGSKILSANQITEFPKQPCLKKDEINQPEILYLDRDSGKVDGD